MNCIYICVCVCESVVHVYDSESKTLKARMFIIFKNDMSWMYFIFLAEVFMEPYIYESECDYGKMSNHNAVITNASCHWEFNLIQFFNQSI